MNKISKLQTLFEFCEWTTCQYPFNKQFGLSLYESLHIVKDFDNCIDDITNFMIYKIKIKSLEIRSYNTNYFYSPELNISTKEEFPGCIPIYICILDSLFDDSLVHAEPKSETNSSKILISFSFQKLLEEYNKKRDQSFEKFLHQTLKHEFKHIKTIWSNKDIDALYQSKKYKKDKITKEEAYSTIYGYRFHIVDMITYLLNEDEAIAHINALYDRYENDKDKYIKIYQKEINQIRDLNRTKSIIKLISLLDINSYFSILDNILSSYENQLEKLKKGEVKNNKDFIVFYEIYMIRYHLRNHKFFKDYIDSDQEVIKTKGKLLRFEKYKTLNKDLIYEDSYVTLNGIRMIIAEIKRCLASAIFNDIRKYYLKRKTK